MTWTAHVVTVAPADMPLTAIDLREHCRADDDGGEDTLLMDDQDDAVSAIEAETGSRLLTQTARMTRRRFDHCMPLLVGPVQSVSLTYLDATGQQQTVDPATYAVVGIGTLQCFIELIPGQQWPTVKDHPAAITCTAVVGYGDTGAALPGAIKRAIRLLVGDYYANREDTIAERSVTPATLPNGVKTLLANYRIW